MEFLWPTRLTAPENSHVWFGVIAAFIQKTVMMNVGKVRVLKQLSIHLSVSLSKGLSMSLSMGPSVGPSMGLSMDQPMSLPDPAAAFP